MDLRLSNYLGILREDPHDPQAQTGLSELVIAGDTSRLGEDPVRLLEAARQGHEQRGEWTAVATLLRAEATLFTDEPELRRSLLKELGRVRSEHLIDDQGAQAALEEALALGPDKEASDALKRIEQGRSKWKEISKRFIEEADETSDLSLRISLMLRAASLIWQHKKKGRVKEVDGLLEAVLKHDPGNLRAAQFLELTLRERGQWSKLAERLIDIAEHVNDDKARLALYLQAARVCAKELNDTKRAVACYERVLDIDPADAETLGFLAKYFADNEQWDHLAGLYEDALRTRQKLEVEQALLLQISMVHWKMRGRADAAEPYFSRLRKLDPTHFAVLEFAREHYSDPEHVETLLSVLGDAQRAASDPAQRLALSEEIAATLQAQAGQNDRAIEAWKVVLRNDPAHPTAAPVLKELYAKSNKWNALVEVLRNEIEALPESAVERKVSLLREMAEIYREFLRMDGMVVNTYNAILKLLPGDRQTLDDLAARYRAMSRYNDLIALLTQEAETHKDEDQRVELYLEVARLWIEHFSNFNQATVSLEQVVALRPGNERALRQLKDIYEKKRAWNSLYEVLRREREASKVASLRAENAAAMARLLSDRLHRNADAIALWREVITEQPSEEAFEAFEKLAEREKDYAALAEVLERRLAQADDAEEQLRVLQKLGLIYSDRLEDGEQAKGAYRRMLALDPHHGRALRSLRDTFVAEGDWAALEDLFRSVADLEGLVEVLTSEAERTQDAALKVELSFRAAKLCREELSDEHRSLRSYERILAVEPHNLEAAQAVLPIYEREEKFTRAVAVLERMLETAEKDDTEGRVSLLSRLARLSLERLRDADAAFGYASQAFKIDPGHADVRSLLETAAASATAFDRLCAVYTEVAESLEPSSAIEYHRRIGELMAERLGNLAGAAAQYRNVLALAATDQEALLSLERVERAQQNVDGIIDVLQRRLRVADEPETKLSILRELSELLEQHAGDADGAAALYREMAEIEPDNTDVLAHLDRLAMDAGRREELQEILKKRLALAVDDSARVELGGRLGQLQMQLGKTAEAFDTFSVVLERDPAHGAALVALESMLQGDSPSQLSVLAVLEASHERTGRFDKLAKVLEQRMKLETGADDLQRLRLRLAEISSSKLGDAAGAYGALEAAFLEQPGDATLWDRLAQAATEANQLPALAQAYALAVTSADLGEGDSLALSRRAAKLYGEQLGHVEEAEPFHRRVLAIEPLDDVSFNALKKQWTEQERWDDLQGLYRARVEGTVDDSTRVDLLLQMCFLYEEILDRPEQAIETYRAVRELLPDHLPSLRALERLLEETGRHRELSDLLRDNLDHAHGPDQVDLLFRLGQLLETKLGEPNQAVDQYEAVLMQQPTHLRSQEALSRLLSMDSTRSRVAAILEPIYESQGAYQELSTVLEIQLESAAPGSAERIHRLLQLGELHELRLRDPESAFNTYARASEEDVRDSRARDCLRRVSHGREVLRRKRAKVLAGLLEKVGGKDATLAGELLIELATLLDEYLDDQEGAERAYQRLIELDPDDGERVMLAARALERIHMRREDHAGLSQDLERQLTFESDADEQRDLLSRLAILYQDVLVVPERAIEVNRQRLDLQPADRDAAERLCSLLREAERHPELVEALRASAEVEADAATQRALLLEACQVLEESCDDEKGAIEGYRDLLMLFGPDEGVLSSLSALYERTEAYPELVDVLQQRESLAANLEQSLALRLEIASITEARLGDKLAAVDLYESVLEEAGDQTQALNALAALMKDDDPAVRGAAARVSIPRFEAAGNYESLLTALQVQAQDTDVPAAVASLRRASNVAHEGLNQAGQAYDLLARATRLDPGEPDLRLMLQDLGVLAEESGRMREFATLLQEISPEVSDGDVRVTVERTLATVARDKLADANLARAAFSTLLSLEPADREALLSLEQLTTDAGDHQALLDVLGRRAELEDDPDQRAELLLRKADLHERLDEGDRAIEVLEDLVLEAPSPRAFAALQHLYEAAGRSEDELGVYERQLDLGFGDAVSLRHDIARICLRKLEDPGRALSFLRDAVIDDPSHKGCLSLLEELMATPSEFRAVAAEILEAGYLGRMEWEKLTASLEAQLESQQDLDERKRLLVRLSQIYEDQLEDFSGTFAVYSRLFKEDPREEHVWERLSRLARVDGKWSELSAVLTTPFEDGVVDDPTMATLAKFTARILDQRVGDLKAAARLYEMALDFDTRDRNAFKELSSILERIPDLESLIVLYREQADSAESDGERATLLHKRASILSERLQRPTEAIEAYRELLVLNSADERAAQELDRLLLAVGDFEGLSDHLRFRAEQASSQDAAVGFKLRLSQVLREKLSDLSGSIDILEDICAENQAQPDAIAVLEDLVQGEAYRLRITEILEPAYRHQDQWMKLVAILEAQVELRDDRDEQVRLLSEIALLHESRGHDGSLSFDALGRALVIDPDNENVRAEVDRLAGTLGCWDTMVAVYEAALANTTDKITRVQLLTTVARVEDERRGDPRAAIVAYERLFEEEPDETSVLDSLEGLYTLVGDWPGLVRVIERKVELSLDVVERCDLLRRMASVHEELQNDPGKAIETYKRAVEEDPADELSFVQLDRLYTARAEHEPLGQVLMTRLQLAHEPAQRVELGLRLGALQRDHLHRVEDAIESYRGVLADDERNAVAIRELASLFESRAMWPELLDNLAHQVTLSTARDERIGLRCRMADLLLGPLRDAVEAVEQYREALIEDPRHEPAILALVKLVERDDLRDRAGEIVRPLLRDQGRFDELVQVMELSLPDLAEPSDRREHLIAIAQVHENSRKNRSAAFDAQARALAEDPSSTAVQDHLERLAGLEGMHLRLAPLFEQRAAEIYEPSESSLLFQRAGRIYEEELNDDKAAIDAYLKAAERDDDDLATLSHLDRLYLRVQAWDDLLRILDRRVAATGDVDERVDLLLRLGQLREERFDDVHGAFVAYREVLDLVPQQPRALSGLERLGERPEVAADVVEILDEAYRQTGALDKVIGLYDLRARLAPTDVERVQVLREAAVTWERELHEPARAIATLKKAFAVDPNDDDLLAEMERLAQENGAFDELRGVVEQALATEHLSGARSQELCRVAARWYRDFLDDPSAEESMLRRVLTFAPDTSEVHERVIELTRVTGRESDLVSALCAAARADHDPTVRRERYKEAAAVAEQELADLKTAADCFEQVLASDPDDLSTLDELIRVRGVQGDHVSLATAMARRIKLTEHVDERVQRLRDLAELQAVTLNDTEQAIATLQQLVSERPADAMAGDQLEQLLSNAERYDEVAALLERRLAQAGTGTERNAVRVRMASLREQRFGDRDGAIEQLRSILAEDPRHDAALTELERLYESGGRYPELALMLGRRIEQARAAGDRDGEECFLRRLATLYETHLRDQDNARNTYERLAELVPTDVPVLRSLVGLYSAAGAFEQVATILSTLIPLVEGEDVVEANLTLAEVASRHLGDDGRAIQALRAALAVDPNRREVRARLLERLEHAGLLQEVVAHLEQDEAAAETPEEKVALLKRCAQICLDGLGQPERAATLLERATELMPEDRDALLALCDIYIAAGRQADAIPTLERIIASYGGRRAKEVAVYHHRLGRAFEASGDLERAYEHYDAAFKIDLTNVAILRDLGRVCLERNDLERALKTYRALLLQRLGPDAGIQKADVYFKLGQITLRQGDPQRAKAMFQRAVAEGDHPEAAQALGELS